MTQEEIRMSESASRKKHWKRWGRWGPYLSARAWGTVREDYSAYGNAWEYLPHDHARSPRLMAGTQPGHNLGQDDFKGKGTFDDFDWILGLRRIEAAGKLSTDQGAWTKGRRFRKWPSN